MANRWQRSTHSTRPAANTVNLHVPSSLYMHGTHTLPARQSCVKVCVELSQGLIHAKQGPRGRRAGLSGVHGGGGGTGWMLTEGACKHLFIPKMSAERCALIQRRPDSRSNVHSCEEPDCFTPSSLWFCLRFFAPLNLSLFLRKTIHLIFVFSWETSQIFWLIFF